MELLIKSGRLIDPLQNMDQICDILIKNGKIIEISPVIKTNNPVKTINARRKIISPGFIDMHVHLREPGYTRKETIYSGARAAVKGGFTTICCMPNTRPVNDNTKINDFIIKKGKEANLANVLPVASITRGLLGEEITDIRALIKSGAHGFSDDGRCVMNSGLFQQALEITREFNIPVIEHAEDHFISDNGVVNRGYLSEKYNIKGISSLAEDIIVARDIIIQQKVNSKLHLTHISTAGAVELIREAKKNIKGISADATVHHLLLNEEMIDINNSVYKVNPPIRSERDRQELIQGVLDGTIDCIASDHAPHTADEKKRSFNEAPFGMIGMESSFPLFYDRFVKSKILPLTKLIELFSTQAAKIMNLKNRGTLKPGSIADITIFNQNEPFEIKADSFYSKASNCPFTGWKGKGVIEYTIVKGKIKYQRLEDNN